MESGNFRNPGNPRNLWNPGNPGLARDLWNPGNPGDTQNFRDPKAPERGGTGPGLPPHRSSTRSTTISAVMPAAVAISFRMKGTL